MSRRIQSRRNRTRTKPPSRSCSISGSVPLNSDIALCMIGHPRPRRSMKPSASMQFAMYSLRDRAGHGHHQMVLNPPIISAAEYSGSNGTPATVHLY